MTEQGPLSGQKVGDKYLLGELLGEGGFGVVYKSQHLHLQRQQAIKVLLEHHFRKSEFRDRFLREAQTVATLDHPNIIHTDDFWVESSRAYLVMPFISGGTFQDILRKRQGALELEQIVLYLEHICTALDYAHERGVVHLDLKPLNLLVHDEGRLLLADFGLAHIMKQGAIEGGSSLRFGTPHYMAPEHIQGRPEKRSDLFSLGVMLYQMLLGRLPFERLPPEAVMIKNMTEWPPAPRVLRPELSQRVEDVLGKALAKQPEHRYQTARDLLIAFKDALGSAQSSLPPSQAIPEQPTIKMNPLLPSPIPPKKPPIFNLPRDIDYLYVEEGKEPGRVYEIRKEALSIGRDRGSDIFLEDLALSRLHASVVNMGNGNYALKDEGSANGSKLNGQLLNKFQTYPLQYGYRIQLGQTVLVFMRGTSHQVAPIVLTSPLQVLSKMACLRVEEGKEPGRVYEIHKEVLSIGRSRESDIFLEDLALSRLHASVVNMGNGEYVLKDEGSANGSMVNGQLVNKFQIHPLHNGDRIQLGPSVLVFFTK